MGLLISAAEMQSKENLVIFDCSFSLVDADAGFRQYSEAHIPGAHYADLGKHLSGEPGSEGRHPLPAREEFAEQLRQWGVNRESVIVCYDQNVSAYATRMWWMIRWLGHDEVFVLNGGLAGWQASGLAVDTDTPQSDQGNFEPSEPLTKICPADQLPNSSITLLDARERIRFLGESEPIDPVAGHIPGATCLPFTDNLANGYFRSADELRTHFNQHNITGDTVCYCGSGVTATHNIFSLMLAGYEEPALYPGSWSGWITDPSRPLATGP